MKPRLRNYQRLRRKLALGLLPGAIGLALLPVLHLHAQPGETNPPETNAAPPVATTNAAPTNAAPPAAPAEAAPTNNSTTVIFTTNGVAAPAAPGSTNAAPGEQEGPLPPGEMSNPSNQGNYAEPAETIGPPAPGQYNEPEGPMPANSWKNNPAVTDVTNNPNAIAGLGQRHLPLYFGLNVGEMYDDNILIAPNGQQESSFITNLSPSIDYQRGDQTAPHSNYLNLYFSPSIYIYDNPTGLGPEHTYIVPPGRPGAGGVATAHTKQGDFNRIDYTGDIYYQYNWTRLSLGFEQNYQHLTDSTLDEGTLVSRNLYLTKFVGSYIYNDNLTLYGTALQNVSNYPGQTINEWHADTYALYQIAPKLSLGAGPRFSYLDIQNAPNEWHEDLLARLRYVPDTKFIVTFEGGIEYLQYQNVAGMTFVNANGVAGQIGTPSDRTLPIFDLNVTYMPIDDTNLFVEAGRSTLNSFDLHGDNYDYTSIQAGVTQGFLRKFTFTALGSYGLSDYQSIPDQFGENNARHDNYYVAKASIDWTPNDWLKVEASYQWSKNDSSFETSTFTDNQIDLQSTVKF